MERRKLRFSRHLRAGDRGLATGDRIESLHLSLAPFLILIRRLHQLNRAYRDRVELGRLTIGLRHVFDPQTGQDYEYGD